MAFDLSALLRTDLDKRCDLMDRMVCLLLDRGSAVAAGPEEQSGDIRGVKQQLTLMSLHNCESVLAEHQSSSSRLHHLHTAPSSRSGHTLTEHSSSVNRSDFDTNSILSPDLLVSRQKIYPLARFWLYFL